MFPLGKGVLKHLSGTLSMHAVLLCFALCSAIFSYLSLPKIQLLSSQLINIVCSVWFSLPELIFGKCLQTKFQVIVGVTSFISLFFSEIIIFHVFCLVSETLFHTLFLFSSGFLQQGFSGTSYSIMAIVETLHLWQSQHAHRSLLLLPLRGGLQFSTFDLAWPQFCSTINQNVDRSDILGFLRLGPKTLCNFHLGFLESLLWGSQPLCKKYEFPETAMLKAACRCVG